MKKEKGLLIVVSAPAGCGKDTILEKAFEACENLRYSVSATTRQKRKGEKEGEHYYFKTREEFEEMIKQGAFFEHTEYAGNYYGTPKDKIPELLRQGKDVVLKIEVEGAENIKKIFPECVLVFILPPSFEELRRRLEKRGTDDSATIKRRIDIAKIEMSFVKNYDYVIINHELKTAVKDLCAIIRAEKLSVGRGIPQVE